MGLCFSFLPPAGKRILPREFNPSDKLSSIIFFLWRRDQLLSHPPPRPSFLLVALIVMYCWTSVSRPRLRTASGGLSCIYSVIIFLISSGGKNRVIRNIKKKS